MSTSTKSDSKDSKSSKKKGNKSSRSTPASASSASTDLSFELKSKDDFMAKGENTKRAKSSKKTILKTSSKSTKGKKAVITDSSDSDSDSNSNKSHSKIKDIHKTSEKSSAKLREKSRERTKIVDTVKEVEISQSQSSSSNNNSKIINNRSNEMLFFDIETTGNSASEVIEFGAIIVDKFSYKEIKRYTRLIKPVGQISYYAGLIHNITHGMLNDKPRFTEVAAEIYDLMHGRIWVGHSINTADIPILTKAFKAINHALPVEHGRIDTLPLIRKKFGKRAGDLKMASLGKYFGLGVEKHRALDDSIMTFEVLKCISMSHMLESEMPDIFPVFVDVPNAQNTPKNNSISSYMINTTKK